MLGRFPGHIRAGKARILRPLLDLDATLRDGNRLREKPPGQWLTPFKCGQMVIGVGGLALAAHGNHVQALILVGLLLIVGLKPQRRERAMTYIGPAVVFQPAQQGRPLTDPSDLTVVNQNVLFHWPHALSLTAPRGFRPTRLGASGRGEIHRGRARLEPETPPSGVRKDALVARAAARRRKRTPR